MIRVTDHALVRFMERIAGLDTEGLREGLSAALDRAHVAATALGVRKYTVKADGIVYIVVDGALVTLHDNDGKPK